MSLRFKYDGSRHAYEVIFPIRDAQATLKNYRDITHFSRTWICYIGTADTWKAMQVFHMLDVFVWTTRLTDGDHAIGWRVLEFLWRC